MFLLNQVDDVPDAVIRYNWGAFQVRTRPALRYPIFLLSYSRPDMKNSGLLNNLIELVGS